MNPQDALKEQLFSIVEKQMAANEPPETNATYKRLVAGGCSDLEAKQLIGQCVGVEIIQVIQSQQKFNQERFVRNLNNLPNEPTV